MIDKVEKSGESLIQYGKGNDRVYLMEVSANDCPAVINYAMKLAFAHNYSKIFAKASDSCLRFFAQKGFIVEARIPKLFNGKTTGYFLSKFMSADREQEQEEMTVKKVLSTAKSRFIKDVSALNLEEAYTWRVMEKENAQKMAELYKTVFATYPFPIDDPLYLSKTMDENVIYHGIWQDDNLIALSSAEIDYAGQNAEMTDFATLPDYRRHGFAAYLLERMEDDVRNRGLRTAYTIARAYSYGMNITFAKHGYTFAGTLTSNTQISGRLESMNVWYKPLSAE